MTNWGVHTFDIVEWILGLGSLRSVVSMGGRYQLKDNGETPDIQDSLFQFDGWTAAHSVRECSRGVNPGPSLLFFGTKGSLGITRSRFVVTPDADAAPASLIPQFEQHPVGGPAIPPPSKGVRFRTEAIEDRTGNDKAQFADHVRNFLDCIKSRKQPISDLESVHRATTACHLANISLRLGRKIRWDARHETIVGDAEAAGWLVRAYRAPWDMELKALGVG
jgi:predicted dehydrogenase